MRKTIEMDKDMPGLEGLRPDAVIRFEVSGDELLMKIEQCGQLIGGRTFTKEQAAQFVMTLTAAMRKMS